MSLSPSAYDVAQWVQQTALTALSDCGREPISTTYVGSGGIAWDDCCGTLVVVPERIYRSTSFPGEDTNEVICFDGLIAIELSVLLLRCLPVLDERGRAPSQAALDAAYADILGDAAVVYNALTTQFPEYWERTNPSQTFLGAQGGCIGVETRLIIGLEQSQFGICCAAPEPHEPGDPVCKFAASNVRFEPCDDLTSTNVQDAICELAGNVTGIGGVLTPFTVNGGTIGGTQPTFSGPPMFYGNYIRIGDQVTFDIQVDFDNITDFGTGQYFIDLPFPARFPTMMRGACIHDNSNGREYSLGLHVDASQVQGLLTYIGSNGHDEPFDHNSPFNLDPADNFHIQATYIAEPLP